MLNPAKHIGKNSLCVAGTAYGYSQTIQHSLWKLLAETGLIHNDLLTEAEYVVLSRLIKTKYNPAHSPHELDDPDQLRIINAAIDKIVCEIKSWQLKSQKYDAVIAENKSLKNGLRDLVRNSSNFKHSGTPIKLDRQISDIGLSKRSVRLLRSVGIDTLEKLRSCTLQRLQSHARIGVKTLHEIETVLEKYSFHDSADR